MLFIFVEFNKVYHNTLTMAISTIAEIEHLHNVHSGSPQTTQRNHPQITKIYSMIFKTFNSKILLF